MMTKCKRLLLIILISIVLASCTPSPSPTSALPEGFVMISSGQTPLSGTLYGHGGTAVILASRGGQPETEWSSVANDLADEGFTALTIASPESENGAIMNIRLAINFLRDNGFKKILCVGASMGASGCAYNASKPEIIGIVLLTYHGNANLKGSAIPKLFMAAELDHVYRSLTELGYSSAATPKYLIIVKESSQLGATMLNAPGQDLRATFIRFLQSCPDETFSP